MIHTVNWQTEPVQQTVAFNAGKSNVDLSIDLGLCFSTESPISFAEKGVQIELGSLSLSIEKNE